MKDMSYQAVMSRKTEILKTATGVDYDKFISSAIAFDFEGLLNSPGYSLDKIREIQTATKVGNTPLIELKNITKLVRKISASGKGARIFVKDEANNPSGSFKDRRASVSVYDAKQKGYKGVIAATSGNYGAAVASQAAQQNLKAIILQEVYDSRGVGQPEIIEKGRKCAAYGAEVIQMSVGPELFYIFLRLLEETGYFSASLYTPFAITGIETLGYEIGTEMLTRENRPPDTIIITHAGGGNVTGTARGLLKANCPNTKIVGVSVDLSGLHMASDTDFNRKSFTTGHTGFGVPFATWPDRAEVPRNAARSLRYMDRYVTISQGEVFYVTEMLAQLEGIERGPAGNTSLAAAISIAQEMNQDEILVVQETEYTGAGKHPTAQLTFARENGVKIKRGDPKKNVPGKVIIVPQKPEKIKVVDFNLDDLRKSYIHNAVKLAGTEKVTESDIKFLAEDIKSSVEFIKQNLKS